MSYYYLVSGFRFVRSLVDPLLKPTEPFFSAERGPRQKVYGLALKTLSTLDAILENRSLTKKVSEIETGVQEINRGFFNKYNQLSFFCKPFAYLHMLEVRKVSEKIMNKIQEVKDWREKFDQNRFSPNFEPCLNEGIEKGYISYCFNEVPFLGGHILHVMAKSDKYKDFISSVMRSQINPSIPDDLWGNTALHWALANASNDNAWEILRNLPDKDPSLNVQCTIHGHTPLHIAVAKGYKTISRDGRSLETSNLAIVNALLSKGANPNLQDEKGNTPLHLAYLRGDRDMIEALSEAGAFTRIENKENRSPPELWDVTDDKALEILSYATAENFILDLKERKKDQNPPHFAQTVTKR